MVFTKQKILDLRVLLSMKFSPRIGFSSVKFCSNVDFSKELTTEIKKKIEIKWKPLVNKSTFEENSEKQKFYILSMFPYPSGNLHMGHVRVYTISDAISRFHRLKSKNVLHPIGFDAFGLPAENAARDRNISADKWTENNIAAMREQLKQLGFTFDWDKEIITSSPEYYKFTQYLFLLLYKEGFVYREKAVVNWDPIDETVLANEQVDAQGRSWRSGALVEKRYLKQWFIRTTKFAQSLYSGLDNPKLKDWRDVVALQKHWIGECDGASFIFKLFDAQGESKGELNIWVKYPEMINYATFVAISSKSVLGRKILEDQLVLTVKSPFFSKLLPLYVSDSLDYPEGCDNKLGIPSFSEEDAKFAKNCGLSYDAGMQPCINIEERIRLCQIALKNNLGGTLKSSKLKDWLISRQRHWGTPIPIIHCDVCGPIPVSFNDLPVLLSPRDQKPSSLPCPKCGGKASRETDTMDTFVDSAWYFLRYVDPNNSEMPFSRERVDSLLPVDVYVGGKEHAVLHLYYARFMCYFLHSVGLLKEPEPFVRLLVQGMVTGKTYCVKKSGKYLKEESVIKKANGSLIEAETGEEVVVKWEKMSKSRYNGVEPTDVLNNYGIDTTRLLILADVAPTSQRRWSHETFAGILNWQKRLWFLMDSFLDARKQGICEVMSLEEEQRLFDARNFYVKGTTFNYGTSHQLSVAVSKMQGLTNSLKKSNKNVMCRSLEFERTLAALIIMLSPMAPHFCSELWSALQKAPGRLDIGGEYIKWDSPLLLQKWPTLDPNYMLEFICKVNNAVKATLKLTCEQLNKLEKDSAFRIALEQDEVLSFIAGRDVLSFEYEFVESYEATINIVINHLQRRKIFNNNESELSTIDGVKNISKSK
ncbi:leucyl-tRNA synthetase, mitochondrial [Rhodnius prolixus]|uniref:leucyl-tRNA synthetase, mitochondrial n=1 Tax=Rhodnius prolixus TaxID=13249 RepID=UPI003D189D25